MVSMVSRLAERVLAALTYQPMASGVMKRQISW